MLLPVLATPVLRLAMVCWAEAIATTTSDSARGSSVGLASVGKASRAVSIPTLEDGAGMDS